MIVNTIKVGPPENLTREQASDLGYRTRFVCNFLARCSRIESSAATLLLIDLNDRWLRNAQSTTESVIARVVPTKETIEALLAAVDKKFVAELVSVLVEQGTAFGEEEGLVGEGSVEKIRSSMEEFRDLEYRNLYPGSQKSFSPNRLRYAQVLIDLGLMESIGYLVVSEKAGNECCRHELFRVRPDELLYAKWLVKPKWISPDTICVQPKSWSRLNPVVFSIGE